MGILKEDHASRLLQDRFYAWIGCLTRLPISLMLSCRSPTWRDHAATHEHKKERLHAALVTFSNDGLALYPPEGPSKSGLRHVALFLEAPGLLPCHARHELRAAEAHLRPRLKARCTTFETCWFLHVPKPSTGILAPVFRV